MLRSVFVPGTDRKQAIFVQSLKKAHVVDSIFEERQPELELHYLNGDMEIYTGEVAMELWISLRLADYRTDGNHAPIEVVTPFGRRPVE